MVLSMLSRTVLEQDDEAARGGDEELRGSSNAEAKDRPRGHPSIMKLYDAIDTHRHLYLVLENCEGEMLHSVVKEHAERAINSYRKCLPEEACAQIFYQIILGMSYFHQKNISHRDIKLENILVDYKSREKTTKIIDFGFAIQTRDANEKLRTFCGTPAYMSPELCKKKEYSGPASDTWAAGVLLYTLLFGTQPFKARTEVDLFKAINQGHFEFPKSSHPDFQADASPTTVPGQAGPSASGAASAKRQRTLHPPPHARRPLLLLGGALRTSRVTSANRYPSLS